MTYQSTLIDTSDVAELRARVRTNTISDTALREAVLSGKSDDDIRKMLTDHGDAQNAGPAAAVAQKIADTSAQAKGALGRREEAERHIDTKPVRKVARKSDPDTRMSVLGWAGMIMKWLLAMAFMGFGGILFASLIHKAGVSLAYAQNFWLCIVAVSPVFIASKVVHGWLAMPKEHDARHRRVQRWLLFSILLFVLWAVLSPMAYLGLNGGVSGGGGGLEFGGLLDAPAAPTGPVGVVSQIFDFVTGIMNGSVIGTLAVIVHLIVDVFLAGGILGLIDHHWKASRPMDEKSDPSMIHGTQVVDDLQARIGPLEDRLSALRDIEADIAQNLERFVSSAMMKVEALRARHARMQGVGTAIADAMFATDHDVADMVTLRASRPFDVTAPVVAPTPPPGAPVN